MQRWKPLSLEYRWPISLKTEISAYLNASSSREVRWTFTQDGMLALWSDDMVLNLISTEDWALSAYAVNCLGYVPDQELLLCYRPAEDDGYRLCSYHRYSTQELVDRGALHCGQHGTQRRSQK